MRGLENVLVRRSAMPAPLRWGGATALLCLTLAVRYWLGPLQGSLPALSFYPALLITAVLFGWLEACFVLLAALILAAVFFTPRPPPLMMIGWLFVGGLNIALVTILLRVAERLALANERQRLLFLELQHRIANTLQFVAGTLELVKRNVAGNPDAAEEQLRDAIGRIGNTAEMHRRLHDPAVFDEGLKPLLSAVLPAIIGPLPVTLLVEIEPIELSLEQMSSLTLLVLEATSNAVKHVFLPGHGSRLEVSLRGLPRNRVVLSISDDGPGLAATGTGAVSAAAATSNTLGMRIIRGLARQLGGTLRMTGRDGSVLTVEFPRISPLG